MINRNMKQAIYIDKGRPIVALAESKLSDGSIVWNLHFRGGQDDHEIIHCVSEKAADEAFVLIASGLRVATGQDLLIL